MDSRARAGGANTNGGVGIGRGDNSTHAPLKGNNSVHTSGAPRKKNIYDHWRFCACKLRHKARGGSGARGGAEWRRFFVVDLAVDGVGADGECARSANRAHKLFAM